MDDRTTQIKEGAGLEESRINKEFVELLQKWSSPVLLILLLIVGAYAGNNLLKQRKNDRVNDAFNNHTEITETASPAPASLSAVAEEYADVRGVGLMAKLRHADILLQAVRIGVKPGAEFLVDENNTPTGDVAEEDRLSDDDATRYLTQAAELYESVADTPGEDMGDQVHRVAAFFGIAAVAETRGDEDAAARAYANASEAASLAGFEVFERLADARLASVSSYLKPVVLVDRNQLPEEPEIEAEAPALSPIDLGPVGPEAPVDAAGEQDEPAVVDGDQLPAPETPENDE